MQMPILHFHQASPKEFVGYWRGRYNDPLEKKYEENIGPPLEASRILELFYWKNGTPLSRTKKESVQRHFIDRVPELKQLPPGVGAGEFLKRFADGGAIWRIFWLHCWQPERFPIYDQHVHRATKFIENGSVEEIPKDDETKLVSYIESYIPFYSKFKEFDAPPRTVDMAFWAFGKFLKAWEPTTHERKLLSDPSPFSATASLT